MRDYFAETEKINAKYDYMVSVAKKIGKSVRMGAAVLGVAAVAYLGKIVIVPPQEIPQTEMSYEQFINSRRLTKIKKISTIFSVKTPEKILEEEEQAKKLAKYLSLGTMATAGLILFAGLADCAGTCLERRRERLVDLLNEEEIKELGAKK